MEDLFKKDNYKNIILSPHLDDAVISLGGFIYKNKLNTKIITIFAGKPIKNKITRWDFQCGFINSSKALDSRILENNNALSYLGVSKENILNLDFLDRQYLPIKHNEVYEKELIEKLFNYLNETITKEIEYSNINLFAPISNINKDHRVICNLLNYFKNNYSYKQMNNIKLFYYEDYPYFPKFKKVEEYNKKFIDKKIIINITPNEFQVKINAIRLYSSQFRFPLTDLRIFFNRLKNNKGNNFNKEIIYELD